MKIKKMFQGTVPENKILNTYSDSQTDVYSCDYINNLRANIITDGEPVKAGYKIDGKDVYIKRVSLDSLPNSTVENYSIGLKNILVIDQKISILTNNVYGKLPNDYSHLNYNVSTGNLSLDVSVNLSSYTGIYTLEFLYND